MGWEHAITACREIWDIFEKQFALEVDNKIDLAKNAIAQIDLDISDVPGSNTTTRLALESDLARMQKCKEAFPEAFKKKREAHEIFIANHLLKQTKRKRKLDFVSSRSPKGLIKARDRKHPQKRKRKDPTKRQHRKTGRPRGWNLRKYVAKVHRGGRGLTLTDRRKARGFARKQFRMQHRANNLVRSARPLVHRAKHRRTWKAYPLHRAPKVAGWLENFLAGK